MSPRLRRLSAGIQKVTKNVKAPSFHQRDDLKNFISMQLLHTVKIKQEGSSSVLKQAVVDRREASSLEQCQLERLFVLGL